MIELALLEDLVEGSEHGEIAAPRTPRGVIGGDGFFGELSRGGSTIAGDTPAATGEVVVVVSLIKI